MANINNNEHTVIKMTLSSVLTKFSHMDLSINQSQSYLQNYTSNGHALQNSDKIRR